MRSFGVIAAVLVTLSAPAFAQEQGSAVEAKLQAGLGLELLPAGELNAELGGTTYTVDTAVAFGFAPFFDYTLTPNLSIGLAPRFLLHVQGEDADASAKQLDLRARVMGRYPVATKLTVFGYAAPGYSIEFPPGVDGDDDVDRPAGFILAFAAGASYDLTPSAFASFELGYQLGWQKIESMEVSDNYLHLGAAVGVRF